MSKNIRNEAVDNLFAAILSLSNREECYRFFEDICTVNELLSSPSALKLPACCAQNAPILKSPNTPAHRPPQSAG